MMPDYVAFSTRVVISFLLAPGSRPGGPGPPTAWVPPSRAEGGKSSRAQPRRMYSEKLSKR